MVRGTNYPVVLSIFDQIDGFILQMETVRDIDPHRGIEQRAIDMAGGAGAGSN